MYRFLLSLLVALSLSACATNRLAYRPSSSRPLAVRISPNMITPAKIAVMGVSSQWTIGAGYAAGGLLGAGLVAGALADNEVLPPLHNEFRNTVLNYMTPLIQRDPRFILTTGRADAEFQFEVESACFIADSMFSSDLKPLVSVKGKLVELATGRLLWKYEIEFQESRRVPSYGEHELRRSAALQAEALRTATLHGCQIVAENLHR